MRDRVTVLKMRGKYQNELDTVKSQLGPIILAIIGFFLIIFIVGIPIIFVAAYWGYAREKRANMLIEKIALLDDELLSLQEEK